MEKETRILQLNALMKIKLTLQKYSVYFLQERPNMTSSIMKAHKLMQQYSLMAFARDQAHTLNYHWENVSTKSMENLNVLQ